MNRLLDHKRNGEYPFVYTNSVNTDIRGTFKAWKEREAKAAAEQQAGFKRKEAA